MSEYRKLPGSYHTPISGGKMRLAADHLLVVTSYRVQEQYRRFYLRDIQAITITRSARWTLTTRSVLLGLFILLFGVSPLTALYAWLTLAVLAVAWIILCVWAGCTCRIYTAVSAETLPVRRIWQANKLLAQLEPLVREAQSNIDWQAKPEAAGEQLLESDSAADQPAAVIDPATSATPEPARYRTLAGILLSGTLFLAAVAAGARYLAPNAGLVYLIEAILAAQLGIALWVIIEHARQRTAHAPQRLAIVFLVLVGLAGYVQSVASTVAGAQNGRTKFGAMYRAPDAAFWNVYGIGCLVLAIISAIAWVSSPEKEAS